MKHSSSIIWRLKVRPVSSILNSAQFTTHSRTMASTTRQQPPWQAPRKSSDEETSLPPLKLYNSLTKSKNLFVPIDPKGKKVTWYCCGPTVYDAGHLGHARNYVSTDILRRIMRDYFGFDVNFVMNITDVDDKIILRARQRHLLDQYMKDYPKPADSLKTSLSAFHEYASKQLPRLPKNLKPEDWKEESTKEYGKILSGGTIDDEGSPGEREAKIKMHLATLKSASEALEEASTNTISSEVYYAKIGDVLLPYLDSRHGSEIKKDDYEIFTKLTRHWEQHFKEDLRTLNCLPPTLLTRVTEYIPENVSFVDRLVKKGFAYPTSDGSVYFDIAAFEKAGNSYARLEPWNRNDKDLQADGEGSLTKKTTEKKSSADFALWKSSKPGEPSWESPWGRGRPGWHIECSVMCSDVLGKKVDIHSGGIDLAFPHHDNELAQSEAYWVEEGGHQHQWINYFLHMGHLSIQGSKMSKSLKNFTTIREALSRGGSWTARGLRIVFLLGGWKERIEITDDVIAAGKSWENSINKYFTNIAALISEAEEKEQSGQQIELHFRPEEHELIEELERAQTKVHDALCDSFNTPVAMAALSDLITKANIYITQGQKTYLNPEVAKEVARWITQIINVFGLDGSVPGARIGWSTASSSEGVDANQAVLPYLRVLSNFRHEIRRLAMSQQSPMKKKLLDLCDKIRDQDLTNLGVYLDDRDINQLPLIKFVPKDELIRAREERNKELAFRESRKEEARLEREKANQEKADKGKQSHLEMFKTAEYSAWDGDGLPTKDSQGEEITKSRSKKLKKDWERQKKAHEAWLSAAGDA